MTKTIRKRIMIWLFAIACILFSASAIGVSYTAKAEGGESIVNTKPILDSGASVRTGDRTGIRFTVGVEEKDEASEYGILIARESYREGKELTLENVGDEIKKVVTSAWGVPQTVADVECTNVYHHVIYDIPTTDYNTQLAVRAYRTNAGETEYSDATVVRSVAETAAGLLKSGKDDAALYAYVDGTLSGVTWDVTLDAAWLTLSSAKGWVKNINVTGLAENLKDKVIISSSDTSVVEIVYVGTQPQYKVVGAGDADIIVKLGNSERSKSVHIAEAALYQDIDAKSDAWKFGNVGIDWQSNTTKQVAFDDNMSFELYATDKYDETLKQYYVLNDQDHKVVSAGIEENTVDWYNEWDGGMSHTFTASGKIKMELRLTMEVAKHLRIALVPQGQTEASQTEASQTEFVNCPAGEAVSRDIEYDINVGDTIYLFFTTPEGSTGGDGTISLVFHKIG